MMMHSMLQYQLFVLENELPRRPFKMGDSGIEILPLDHYKYLRLRKASEGSFRISVNSQMGSLFIKKMEMDPD